MRISDWSSDVCSSDLEARNAAQIVLDRRYADRPVAGPLDPSALARGGDEDRESLGRIAVAFAFAGREVARSAHPPIGVIFIDNRRAVGGADARDAARGVAHEQIGRAHV